MSQDARHDEELNTQRRARILGLQYADTSAIKNKQLYKEILSNKELTEARIIPLISNDHSITFGVTNNTPQATMKSLGQRFLEQRVSFVLISDAGFREYMTLYDPPQTVVYHDISIKATNSGELMEQVSATLEQVRADDMLGYLVQQAHKLNASDIHIETQRDHVRIRFRMDGVLHPIAKLSQEKYRTLISAIASAGNVSTAADGAQQGHISQHLILADGNEVDVNLRLETVPTVNGMDVVTRLFNMNSDMYTLDRLGLAANERAVVDDIINKPSGLVMVVGPTGSGKTTTLYSMLNTLNTDERKIITVEDPVEFQFAGITQIPILGQSAHATSFADSLRAILRLDPDIVMVGEIRDMDTAKTALQAALTGHLVLATFHASSAAAALTRMVDVIGENPLFVSAIRLVMAQRLVRKLDQATRQSIKLDEATLRKVQTVVDTLPATIARPDLHTVQFYGPGSSPDNPYGYSGQMALREQFLMTGAIRELMESGQKSLSSLVIEEAAIKSGMLTMLQQGILQTIAGNTTIDEVYRVVG